MTIPVVFSSNQKYLPYLATAICSLISNARDEKLAIFVLHNGLDLSHKDIKKVNNLQTDKAKIEWIDVRKYLDSVKNNLVEIHHFSKEMYNRILIPKIFPDFEKVIYLDCDIVVKCNIRELYEIDLEDKLVAAVPDIGQQIQANQEPFLVVDKNKYFNSGVIVFNCPKLVEFQLFEKFLENLKECKNFTFPDQDLLNILLEDKVHYLDYSYNIQQGVNLYEVLPLTAINPIFKRYLFSIQEPKIIHFTSNKKPLNSASYDCAFIWHSYFSKTEFYDDYFFERIRQDVEKISQSKLFIWQIKAKLMKKKRDYYRGKVSRYFENKKLIEKIQTEKDLQ
ncbi:MAG: glycosyltransferase family 8 protein [Cardiobacteriaceae bacterium]|nr:glycosyltransferase family 8 protein [Cardiobacteriaceae bacterium]